MSVQFSVALLQNGRVVGNDANGLQIVAEMIFMSDLWNAIHKEEETMLKHTIKLNTRKAIVIIYTLTTFYEVVIWSYQFYSLFAYKRWIVGVIETLSETFFA